MRAAAALLSAAGRHSVATLSHRLAGPPKRKTQKQGQDGDPPCRIQLSDPRHQGVKSSQSCNVNSDVYFDIKKEEDEDERFEFSLHFPSLCYRV